MTVEDFKGLLHEWKEHSWLCNHDFTCDDGIIYQSIACFETDYNRWYPNESVIDISRLRNTPQLIAMLLYRVSRVLYIRELSGGGKRCLLAFSKTYWTD